ncbi:receptor-like protein kinase [Trifolium pratense]|uniref:Receptor-like protein kinase n=1 Tax=Trifolium pratense TaxID=57577 RepID=A0A2K3NUX6_TRIPR|nr:receptor-like protein kinase [Trifolium pratense]
MIFLLVVTNCLHELLYVTFFEETSPPLSGDSDFVRIPSHVTISPSPSVDLPIALHKGWRQAMIDEMIALESTDTWKLVPLPPKKSMVGCRGGFAIKVGPDGQVDRLKARLVAKGYTQMFMILTIVIHFL